jgi:hypothetical protein
MRRYFAVGILVLSACGVPVSTTLSPAVETGAASSRNDEMQATDPSTVELAAGRPQVIEFFAFW